MKYLQKIVATLSGTLLLVPFFAQAACDAKTALCNPLGYDSLTMFLNALLEIVAQIGFPIIVLFIVYVGFLFITAEGNPEKLKKARSYFLWVVIGALIVLGAQALSYAIQGTVEDLKQGIVR